MHALGFDHHAALVIFFCPNLLKQAKTEGFFQQRELRKTDTARAECVGGGSPNRRATYFGYCKSRIFRMLFTFVNFVRGGFRTNISCVQMRCDRFIRIKDQRLYENFMHTKGRRSPTYENLVRTKFSGFTVCPAHF